MKTRSSAYGHSATYHSPVAVLLLLWIATAHANSQIVVDAAGHAVGYWVDQSGICNDVSTMPVYSFDGYLACFLDTGEADFLLQPPGTFGPFQGGLFSTPDCSGSQYATQVAGPEGGGYVVATSQGLMVALMTGVNMTPVVSSIWVGSPESGSCTSVSPIQYSAAVLLFPFDYLSRHPFNPSPYLPPLTVQSLPNTALLDVIFFDSLDVEY